MSVCPSTEVLPTSLVALAVAYLAISTVPHFRGHKHNGKFVSPSCFSDEHMIHFDERLVCGIFLHGHVIQDSPLDKRTIDSPPFILHVELQYNFSSLINIG